VFAWPASFAQRPSLPGHDLDLPIEVVVADGLILVERHAELAERGVVQRRAEQVALNLEQECWT